MRETYTPDEAEIEALRSELTEEEKRECKNLWYSQNLRAESGNLKRAASRLKATLKWRREVRPGTIECALCIKNPQSHYLHNIGFTKSGCPIMYSCSGMVSDRTPEASKQHMIMVFEQAVRLMGPGVERWVWFADFEGFGLRDCAPGQARNFVEVSSTHYPEHLEAFYLVGTPSIFSLLYNAILPFVDPVSKEKIKLLPYDVNKEDSKLLKAMHDQFAPDAVTFLLKEMEENRSTLAKTKVYSQEDLSSALESKGTLNSHWGSESLLSKLAENPALLKPGAGTSISE